MEIWELSDDMTLTGWADKQPMTRRISDKEKNRFIDSDN